MTNSRISWVQKKHAEGVIVNAKMSGDKTLN